MPRKTWTLTDVDAGIYLEELSLGPDQVGGPGGAIAWPNARFAAD